MPIRTIMTGVLLATCIALWGQAEGPSEPDRHLARMGLYATGGLGLGTVADLSYELRLFAFRSNFWNDLRLKASVGATLLTPAFVGAATLGVVIGTRSHHIEVALGIVGYSSVVLLGHVLPALNIGYRFQLPGRSPIVRLGAGVPEGLYLSLGYGF